ncbi:DUF3152 domain-containing protein [Streptomyces sp. NPDC020996]|uniref:DUF3152 domain-containing protein n=1 Tax=Streptomyces sp. NPDC020996 TaxID=3154791 RepID=UPI0033ECF34B
MGRHSRRGAAKGGAAATTAGQDGRSAAPQARADVRRDAARQGAERQDGPGAGAVPGVRQDGRPQQQGPAGHRMPGPLYAQPHGQPYGLAYGQQGAPLPPTGGTPAGGVPRMPDGTPAHGFPRVPRVPMDGTPAHGFPRVPMDGTPAHGFPRVPVDGTPARGVPRVPDGTPAHGVPQVRGGHPEQREAGGGWGELRGPTVGGHGVAAAPGAVLPRQRRAAQAGPRQDYLDAFDEDDDVFAPRARTSASVTGWDPRTGVGVSSETDADDDAPPTGVPAHTKGTKGRTFTGIAAAAVTTVLAVVVAGQVADGQDDGSARQQSAAGPARDLRGPASRGEGRTTPSAAPGPVTLTYEQAMARKYPLSATLKGSGKFDAVPGSAKAPGKGRKYTYRVDVEQGLGLDGELFAQAVQKTLNDDRSWAHGGARTFERVHSGEPDFVITLASPGTTAAWCAKSGLDTTQDNVSCDSAATERIMINAYRWAQGSKTYGDQIHAYRQMLINHEVGHRLGYSHVTCDKDGELAPVMQQQTKFLDHNGVHCLPNPWAYPGS